MKPVFRHFKKSLNLVEVLANSNLIMRQRLKSKIYNLKSNHASASQIYNLKSYIITPVYDNKQAIHLGQSVLLDLHREFRDSIREG